MDRSTPSPRLGNPLSEAVEAKDRPLVDIPTTSDDPVTAPRKLITAEVERRCVQFRVAGWDWEDIAAEVGIHWETAVDYVERVLIRTRGKADSLADKAREIELRRCDAIIKSFWDRATDPSMAKVDVPADTETGVKAYDGQDKAADRLLKAMERRAKLLGLDAPTGPAVQINISIGEFGRAVTAWLLARAPELRPDFAAWLGDVSREDTLATSNPAGWVAARRQVIEALPEAGGVPSQAGSEVSWVATGRSR